MGLEVLHIAAFSDGATGGNPAGVVISGHMPEASLMQQIAAELGYSETVFAAPAEQGWRVRYFAPEAEVPFCGHATIALGAALALREGDGVFDLQLNQARITVQGQGGDPMRASLQSPPSRSRPTTDAEVEQALQLFGLTAGDLDDSLAPAVMHAGVDHLLLVLKQRSRLARMDYDLEQGRALMKAQGWTTIMLSWVETPQQFHVRNAFAIGGVLEDPATGAAAAALAGHLRSVGWPHGGHITIVQGEDMGMRSLLAADITSEAGASIRVSGDARLMKV
ncbi:MAG: PhzF family phenazine biosynthesis protein [Burkholderiaceae bacterium]|nr:PhzF family phenazine biosynthesis protein [Burkholderiaceae bacterium]